MVTRHLPALCAVLLLGGACNAVLGNEEAIFDPSARPGVAGGTGANGGSSNGGTDSNGGSASNGGTTSSGGSAGNGGTTSSGGSAGNGGTTSSGGTTSNGGQAGSDAAGAGGTGGPAFDCDTETSTAVPVLLTETYFPSGYFEESYLEMIASLDSCPDRPAGAQGSCMTFPWVPDVRTWVGLTFQYPANNWDGPGLCIAGATKVTFSARGENGGEEVSFGAVGAELERFALSSTWQSFQIDISAIDYNAFNPAGGVNRALDVVLWREAADTDPKTVYVDDIRWE